MWLSERLQSKEGRQLTPVINELDSSEIMVLPHAQVISILKVPPQGKFSVSITPPEGLSLSVGDESCGIEPVISGRVEEENELFRGNLLEQRNGQERLCFCYPSALLPRV